MGSANEGAAGTFLAIWQPREPLFTINKVKKRDGVGFGVLAAGRNSGGADCASFGAEGERRPPLATNLSFLNSTERSEGLLEVPGAP